MAVGVDQYIIDRDDEDCPEIGLHLAAWKGDAVQLEELLTCHKDHVQVAAKYTQWLKRGQNPKKMIESKIGGIFSAITSRVTTKKLKIGQRGNFDLEPFLSFFAHFHLFLGWFGTPSSQYKVPLILVRDQRNLLRPFGSPKK